LTLNLTITVTIHPATDIAKLMGAPTRHMITPLSLLYPKLTLWALLVPYGVAESVELLIQVFRITPLLKLFAVDVLVPRDVAG
jgi:hypothetical protein